MATIIVLAQDVDCWLRSVSVVAISSRPELERIGSDCCFAQIRVSSFCTLPLSTEIRGDYGATRKTYK